MDSRWRMTTAFHLLLVCAVTYLINKTEIFWSFIIIYHKCACIVCMLLITVSVDAACWKYDNNMNVDV